VKQIKLADLPKSELRMIEVDTYIRGKKLGSEGAPVLIDCGSDGLCRPKSTCLKTFT